MSVRWLQRCWLLAAAIFMATPVSASELLAADVPDELIIERTADTVYPNKILLETAMQTCDAGYKTSLSKKPELSDAESVLPGLRERMADAALSYCREVLPGIADSHTVAVRAVVLSHLNAMELRRLFPIFSRLWEQAERLRLSIDIRPGETPLEAARRAKEPDYLANSKFASQFFAQPGNRDLARKLGDLQEDVLARRSLWENENLAVIKQAMAEGHRVANAYAKEKGYGPLYAED